MWPEPLAARLLRLVLVGGVASVVSLFCIASLGCAQASISHIYRYSSTQLS